MTKYEFLAHPADIKVRAFGKDLAEVFVNSALGMMDYLFGKPNIKLYEQVRIEVDGEDAETLLVNWLSEILSLSNINKCLYANFIIEEFANNKIIAIAVGGAAIAKDDIKAVTYHDLQIIKHNELWSATVVYDI